MSSPSKLTLSGLTEAVAGSAVAIRSIARLLPAGGPTDKVFPPTYIKDNQSVTSGGDDNVPPIVSQAVGTSTNSARAHTSEEERVSTSGME